MTIRASRRSALRHLGGALVLSASPSVLPLIAHAAPRVARSRIALLLPLSGNLAPIGLAMRRAAELAFGTAAAEMLIVADTATGAAAAATKAIRQGAKLILGPLSASDVAPVVAAAAGRVPVLTFSNDAGLIDSGAFVFGITPSQATGVVLQYARGRGVRSVAVAASETAWSRAAAAEAIRLQAGLGLAVRSLGTVTPETIAAGLRGGAVDALFVADGGPLFAAAARAARADGVQLLGTLQAIDYAPAALADIAGAWIAAPDPAGFQDFSGRYAARNGGAPGTMSALAYDAATIALQVAAAGPITREALLAESGFAAITGQARFRTNGSCLRELAVLVADSSGYTAVGKGSAA